MSAYLTSPISPPLLFPPNPVISCSDSTCIRKGHSSRNGSNGESHNHSGVHRLSSKRDIEGRDEGRARGREVRARGGVKKREGRKLFRCFYREAVKGQKVEPERERGQEETRRFSVGVTGEHQTIYRVKKREKKQERNIYETDGRRKRKGVGIRVKSQGWKKRRRSVYMKSRRRCRYYPRALRKGLYVRALKEFRYPMLYFLRDNG